MNQLEEGVNYARVVAATIVFCIGLIFLCCCAASLVLHDYLNNQRSEEEAVEQIKELL